VLKSFEHTATLQFPDAGTAQITVRGQSKPSGDTVEVKGNVVVR